MSASNGSADPGPSRPRDLPDAPVARSRQRSGPPGGQSFTRSPYLSTTLESRLSEIDDEDVFALEPPVISDEPASWRQEDGFGDDDDMERLSDGESDESDYEPAEIPVDESMHAVGVPRSNTKLDARRHATPSFSKELLALMRDEIKLPVWSNLPADFDASTMALHKVSGALTNAVFFVSMPESAVPNGLERPPTVLLRVYGPASGSLVSVSHCTLR